MAVSAESLQSFKQKEPSDSDGSEDRRGAPRAANVNSTQQGSGQEQRAKSSAMRRNANGPQQNAGCASPAAH